MSGRESLSDRSATLDGIGTMMLAGQAMAVMKPDEKIRIRYTTASGRRSERSLWRSQLASAVKRNVEKGITDTEWRPFGGGDWKRP